MKIRIGRRLLKKFLLLLTLALLLLAFPAPGLASQPVTVTLDGEALGFDVPPVLEKGRVLVPLRGIFEALGSKVVRSTGTAPEGR